MPDKGIFTISLDFELFWGVHDTRTIEAYGNNILNVHTIVPRLLTLFDKYEVHCTWATVGFLFLKDKADLLAHLPAAMPGYDNPKFDPYPYIRKTDLAPEYHFAPELIKKIAATKGQEIATHTYSHMYTLEEGITPASFREDMLMALAIAKREGFDLHSIVFPRNQFNDAILQVCTELGIKTYRGSETSFVYESRNRTDETRMRRLIRLLDSYINITGHHTFKVGQRGNGIVSIPSSRFLRPYSTTLAFLTPLQLKRVINALMGASRRGEVFHLWWHPHNFGANIEENFNSLEKILMQFKKLKDKGLMQSLNMYEIYQQL